MPEGDTIYRSAARMREALAGKTVTRFDTSAVQVQRLMPSRLVGQTIVSVEARGKHLLHRFSPSDLVLHTHMRMTGTWRVVRPGGRWSHPEHLARVLIEVDDGTQAVAFAVPVVELLSAQQVATHRVLAALGPDPLGPDPFDLAEARRRLDAREDVEVGVALLDQRVIAGVGNVYANEVAFIVGVDPWTPVREVALADRDELLRQAATLLRANAAHGRADRITTRPPAEVARKAAGPAGEGSLWVYDRAGEPCVRCGTTIRVASLGPHARATYWCRRCQGPGPR